MKQLSLQPTLQPHHDSYYDHFSDALADVKQVKPFVTDYDLLQEPVEFAVRRFEAYEGESQTLFLPSAVMGGERVTSNTFTPSPLSTSSHKRSQHGLFFSRLLSPNKKLRVAVKPFYTDNAVFEAVSEQIKIQAFRDLGMVALRPMGVIIGAPDSNGDRHAYGMTALHEGLTTLDSIEWKGFASDQYRHPGMKEIWKKVADEVALMHATGQVSHQDLESRNIATSVSELGFVIDNETAFINHEKPRDAETRFGNSFTDLDKILLSMSLPRRMQGTSREGLDMFGPKVKDWYASFNDIFLREYISERSKLAMAASKGERQNINEELAQLQSNLQQKAKFYREKILEAQGK
jgi:hypothetical protein